MTRKKTIVNNFQLDDTFDGHACLCSRLSRFIEQNKDANLFAAVESTGGYENNWFELLVRLQKSIPIQAARLNPLGVHAANLQRIITDQISAKNVAEYMVAHPEKITYQAPDGHFLSAQKQWKLIKTLNKQRSQLLTQLESHVYNANPELLQYCKNGTPAWILKLLKRYPTANKLSRAKPSSISKIPYITEKKAKMLILAAKNSIASANDIFTENTITTTVSQILHLTGVINEQNKILVDNFSTPESELLDDIPSVGIESAIGMMIEIQNIERFLSVKKLASYFGLHPVFKESGDKGSGYRMSKKGRKEPRRILYMITLNAIQNNPIISEIYKERTSKGMNNMAAIGLCMHKMLRIMYGILKNKTEFNAEIDRQNREDNKSKQKDLEPTKRKTRRYQEYDPKAPTSRRQHKKRKEQMQTTSQSHNNND